MFSLPNITRKSKSRRVRRGEACSTHGGQASYLPWFSFLNKSCTELKSGLMSGCSAQHCFMMLKASGGAAPLLTDGRISGGGRFTLSIISAGRHAA